MWSNPSGCGLYGPSSRDMTGSNAVSRQRARAAAAAARELRVSTARRFADYPGGHNEGFPDTFKQLFRAFYEYAEAGDWRAPRPFPTFADGHREVVLCEAVLASHRERRWVPISPLSRSGERGRG